MNILSRLRYLVLILLVVIFGTHVFAQIIPAPNNIAYTKGTFDFLKEISLEAKGFSGDDSFDIHLYKDYLKKAKLKIVENKNSSAASNSIVFIKQPHHPDIKDDEGYILHIEPTCVNIIAKSAKGIFYGLQSLLQLIEANRNTCKISCVEIIDYPRFAYRGLHLDVSRHFFSVDFIKKQLDMMAYYKLNTFHWHLTDGPGWRLEIKTYPELTQIAAWRTHEKWKDWWNTKPRCYVNTKKNGEKYGGFYTQQEARDIVAYAAARNITVIPEIEMPGHSEEVLAVYPHLSCTGKPYTSSEFCIGNDSTFIFLKDVLAEVIDIFPSTYIHLGGDEADRAHWKNCPKCQKRIKEEGLKDEAELQSYLIKKIEKYLNAQNRKLIGWDEILEGGLAPAAAIMSWRGEDGGIKAARMGHDVVMTPGAYCYFDAYQANPLTQPEAIGGFLPLQKVYSYNPVPDILNANEVKHILGTQGNVWTEYISTPAHAEYMIYPRLLALSEVAWTEQHSKNWDDFKVRINKQLPFIVKQGYHPYLLSKEPTVEYSVDTSKKEISVSLKTELYPADIRYTLDGATPCPKSKIYLHPFTVKNSTVIKAQLFNKDKAIGKIITETTGYHKAIGKKIIYHTPYSKYYTAGGTHALIDGYRGGINHGDGKWQGFSSGNMEVTIDLEQIKRMRMIKTNFMQSTGAEISFPQNIILSVSGNGIDFKEIKQWKYKLSDETQGVKFREYVWKGNLKARYIKLKANQSNKNAPWIFTDEIIIW